MTDNKDLSTDNNEVRTDIPDSATPRTPDTATPRPPKKVRRLMLRPEPKWNFQNFALAYFLVACIGLYYPDLIVFVWAGYAIIFAAISIRIFKAGGIPKKSRTFVGLTILFAFWALCSILWAFNEQYCLDSTKGMLRSLLMACIVCMMIRTRRQFNLAMLSLAIASVIFALMYLQFIDLTKLAAARMVHSLKEDVDGLPNYNVVAMYLSFGCVYFIDRIITTRMPWWQMVLVGLAVILSVAIIFVFGSRKSILAIVIAFLLFFFAKSSGKKKTQLFVLVAIAVCLVIAFVPGQYLEYILDRMLKLTGSSGALERADVVRIMLVEKGFEFFGEAPVLGHGYYNFSELMGSRTGIFMYAHNNYLETLVDIGIIGFLIYYSIYWITFRWWWKTRKTDPSALLIIAMLLIILFNGFFIVYLSDPFNWCLLAILYIGSRGFREDKGIKRHQLLMAAQLRKLQAERRLARISRKYKTKS